MKTYFYTLILALFISAFTFAQNEDTFSPTQKGQFLVGVNSSFSSGFSSSKSIADDMDDVDGSNSFYLGISPKAGYFIIDNLVAGFQLNLGFNNSKSNGINDLELKSSSTGISIAPFVTYYFGKSTIKPFIGASVGFGTNKYKSESTTLEETIVENTSTSKNFNYNAKGGVAIFLNNKISLDLGLGYTRNANEQKENNPNNRKSINNSVAVNAGFNMFF